MDEEATVSEDSTRKENKLTTESHTEAEISKEPEEQHGKDNIQNDIDIEERLKQLEGDSIDETQAANQKPDETSVVERSDDGEEKLLKSGNVADDTIAVEEDKEDTSVFDDTSQTSRIDEETTSKTDELDASVQKTSGNDHEAFEEVDVDLSEKDKSQQIDENDVLSDDRTQPNRNNSEKSSAETLNETELSLAMTNSQPASPMDVDDDNTENITEDKTKSPETGDVEMRSVESFDTVKESENEILKKTATATQDDKSKDSEESLDIVDKGKMTATCETEKGNANDDEEQPAEGTVDDIEEGKDADEEVCLLPDDSEREITDADKERAILAKEAAEKESEEHDKNQDSENINGDNELTCTIDDDAGDNQLLEPMNMEKTELNPWEIKEFNEPKNEKCSQCCITKPCRFKFLKDKIAYLCDLDCVNAFRSAQTDKYVLIGRKMIISQLMETVRECMRCNAVKKCSYKFIDTETGNNMYLCDMKCLNEMIGLNTEKYSIRRRKYTVEETLNEEYHNCLHCVVMKQCVYSLIQDDETLFICNDDCFNILSKDEPQRFKVKRRSVRVRDLRVVSAQQNDDPKLVARTDQEAEAIRLDREASFTRHCAQCKLVIETSETTLQWETLDFCNELCLGKYQNLNGGVCTTCSGTVPHQSIGKYCVRFGFDIRQFCCSKCLDEFKKNLKVCSYCQKDISRDKNGFLAPVGDKSQFKDFCSQNCMKRYEDISSPRKKTANGLCAVCNIDKKVGVEITLDEREHLFCSNPCFSAFKFVNNIFPDQCSTCTKFFERKSAESYTIYQDGNALSFCCKICMNLFITFNRKIVQCQWCKVKKYNFDMIQKKCGPGIFMLCSVNCLNLYGVSLNAISMRRQNCDQCRRESTPQYHLTMSDASIRNFCTYQCVMAFQSQFGRAPLTLEDPAKKNLQAAAPFPTGLPKRVKAKNAAISTTAKTDPVVTQQPGSFPVIANVSSLAVNQHLSANSNKRRGRSIRPPYAQLEDDVPLTQLAPSATRKYGRRSATLDYSQDFESQQSALTKVKKRTIGMNTLEEKPDPKSHVLVVPPKPPIVSNKQTMCKPATQSKAISCCKTTAEVECQTDENLERKIIVPVPVPVYVPQPMYMYSAPFPIPVPIPLPIPIPIFIPTTRNSAEGILKEIKKIQDKMPADPFEAELLMMAEMVADDKKNDSDSGSEAGEQVIEEYVHHQIEPSNASYGEDVLTMALKMATEYEEPAHVDLETAMTTNTITQSLNEEVIQDHNQYQPHIHHMMMPADQQRHVIHPPPARGRKRAENSQTRQRTSPVKRIKREAQVEVPPPQPEPPKEPAEKPDANMCLKFTFGVNAWKQWVMTKNSDMEKSTMRRKPFKSELLQLTADELNYSLCLFVKEVRKPNGSEYAPDTIFYLVLGIQQYLYENGRIDNIFTDPYYERFTDCLDEVARKFSVLYNDSQYIVTRVEEEHLWECKQLGAHSPHVLLSTLMFFNTKHFNLTTVEEHMQLSFSHIMKHWKRNAPNAKASGSRNVLLRFYPPQTGPDANPRKKKVYEQQENEDNPLRCPVKLYEFYLSKCPESVKTRNDVFYLQPERSCVPDSPVWYSTQALSKEALSKMLHRVKMVKEINIALLTS